MLTKWLSDWYSMHCDGDWEHGYGISIKTLDNPGWELCVELDGTELAGVVIPYKSHETSEQNWYGFKTEGTKFVAFGDSEKLEHLITLFKNLVEGSLNY